MKDEDDVGDAGRCMADMDCQINLPTMALVHLLTGVRGVLER